MFRRVESQEDRHQLQVDLNKLVKWAEKWQMLFNKDKCKCLHIGQANAKKNYLMNNTVLLSTEREKDVGVVVSSDMKVSEQCGIAARKGNQILGLIRRNIVYRDKRLIILLCISLVRPHLEYCIQAWRPHMRKDIDKLEHVQRRATRLISEISQLSYEERLQKCRLTTLETKRIRGDQIEVFKIMHGYVGLNKDMFFRIKNDSITRGHSTSSTWGTCLPMCTSSTWGTMCTSSTWGTCLPMCTSSTWGTMCTSSTWGTCLPMCTSSTWGTMCTSSTWGTCHYRCVRAVLGAPVEGTGTRVDSATPSLHRPHASIGTQATR